MRLTQYLQEMAPIDYAIDLASDLHSGQIRKIFGEPYIVHPKKVRELVRKYKKSKSLQSLEVASILHDTVEDTGIAIEHIRKLFGGLVASLVAELTSDKEEIKKMGKDEYLSQKMLTMSNWGLVIKLADRLANLSDLPHASPEFTKRTIKNTEAIIKSLLNNRDLTKTQKRLILAIKRRLNIIRNMRKDI